MDISRRNARRLAILSVHVALSIGFVVAANSGTNISNKTNLKQDNVERRSKPNYQGVYNGHNLYGRKPIRVDSKPGNI